MFRRTYIGGIVSTGILALTGCASDDGNSADDTGATATPTSTSTLTATPTPQREELVEETLYSRNRYPFDFEMGQRLVISVDVKRGGPVVVDVADVKAGESVFSDTIETEATVEVAIQSTGTHYVTFQNISEASIKVVLVEAID